MKLSDLLKYKDIVIQCHDNPDADALASGYALYLYFAEHNIKPRFIYSGKFPVQKSNLCLMIEALEIPITYVKELEAPELLVTVDCQYDGGNVTHFDAANVAVIDHHQITGALPEMNVVRGNIGSCSTVVWDMLRAEGMDINANKRLATALYYGLMTDTNNFAEIWHPLDKDMRDVLPYVRSMITNFRNSNLSLDELRIAGDALKDVNYIEEHRCGYVESQPCDPNILGIISDMLLEVAGVNACLVYSILPFGVKISVRSCTKEVKASEFAEYVTEGVGNGGGHLEKAGGFLERELLQKTGLVYEKKEIESYMRARMVSYFASSEIIYAGKYKEDLTPYGLYQKKPVKVGYVPANKLGMNGQIALLRTMEGDVDVALSEDVYIMIGVEGEIYPSKAEKFARNYTCLDEPYVFPGEYAPVVKNSKEGVNIEILPYAKTCISKECSQIVGKKLDHRVKVFTSWDEEKYYLGRPGDYLVARKEDPSDVYVIAGKIFDMTYEAVKE